MIITKGEWSVTLSFQFMPAEGIETIANVIRKRSFVNGDVLVCHDRGIIFVPIFVDDMDDAVVQITKIVKNERLRFKES